MSLQPETKLHLDVAERLNELGLLWMHPANGGKRGKVEASILKGMGVKAGVPDIIIFTPPPALQFKRGAYIELKDDGKLPSKPQLEWMAALDNVGWVGMVCRSLDAVEGCMLAWGYTTPTPKRIGLVTERWTPEQGRDFFERGRK